MKALCATPLHTFLRAHLGKHCLAPLTGTDWRALAAFVHLVELYSVTGGTLVALRATLDAAQDREDVHAVFRKAIPYVMDWGDEQRVWALVQSCAVPEEPAETLTSSAIAGAITRDDLTALIMAARDVAAAQLNHRTAGVASLVEDMRRILVRAGAAELAKPGER